MNNEEIIKKKKEVLYGLLAYRGSMSEFIPEEMDYLANLVGKDILKDENETA